MPYSAHIPVIILTALNDEKNRLTSLGLSADSFMGKPFDNQELLLRVQGLMANRERLDVAAGRLAMSKRSFQREIQRLGISWREYKRMRKLRFAMDLLRDPTKRIGIIAEKAGYNSPAHFSKIFKQHTGLSPKKWQQEQQNRQN